MSTVLYYGICKMNLGEMKFYQPTKDIINEERFKKSQLILPSQLTSCVQEWLFFGDRRSHFIFVNGINIVRLSFWVTFTKLLDYLPFNTKENPQPTSE